MKYLYLILILLSFSCQHKILDIKPPDFISYFYSEKQLIFQFNEPIKYFSIQRKDTNEIIHEVTNQVPSPNNWTEQSIFTNFSSDIILNVTDNFSNSNNIEIEKPYIPEVIPEIELKEIYLKPSKNKNQFILLNVKKSGSLEKYKIFYFSNRSIITKSFDAYTPKKGLVKINIIQGDAKDTIDRNLKIFDPNKISSSNGIVGIIDFKNCVIDYLIYYDETKVKDFYQTNTYYSKMKSFISENNLVLDNNNFLSINKMTTKNIISKYKNTYIVNKM